MARSNRMSAQKRLREKKKAEAAELKRMEKARRKETEESGGGAVADVDDLAGYGLVVDPTESETEA